MNSTLQRVHFRRGPGIGMLLMVLTVKFRILIPLIGSSIKWIWQVKPFLIGLIGIVLFGAWEVKKNAFDRLSKAIANCAVQEGMHAGANQTSTFEIERFYEAYLDGFHYLPTWVHFLLDGRESELGDHPTTRVTSRGGWMRFGPEPGATPFLGKAHINASQMIGNLAAWNFVWTPRLSRLISPWAWHGYSEAPQPSSSGELVTSLRLRFLEASEAFGRYIAMLNDRNPGRTPYVQSLIASGQLHVTAADQSRAEGEGRTALLQPAKRHRNQRTTAARDPSAPHRTEREPQTTLTRREGPVIINAAGGLRLYAVTPEERDLVLQHQWIDDAPRSITILPPGMEITRLLTEFNRPAAGNLSDGTYGWIVSANGRLGLIRKNDYETGTQRKEDSR